MRVGRGTQTKPQMHRPGHTGRKALATKKRPITAESGWQEHHNKVNQTFEEIVADLANTRFNKTVFEGTATAQAFEWDIAMETYWPANYGRFRENWNEGAHT